MTIRLYDQDVHTLEFNAVVLSCEEKNGQFFVTLDQTAFFPEGGGQGADHGTLGGASMLDAHEAHGEVVHTLDAPLSVGCTVHGRVDGVRRLSMMQQHSGEHIFSGIVHKLFGYDNVGFHIGTDAVTMDFNGPLTEEDVRRVERLANEAIWADIPVKAWIPLPEELDAMTYRSKKAIDGDVRIVNIEGIDTCACCGTHVLSTGSVGQIKVLSCQKYKSGVRVSILCGMRALDMENAQLEQVRRISGLLSAKQNEIADAAEKLLAERDNLRAANDALAMRLFDVLAAQETGEIRVVACDVLPASQTRKAAAKLSAGAKFALVLVPRDSGWSFALCSETEDVRPATKALMAAFGGRGGGPKDMTQGTLAGGSVEEIRMALQNL